MSADTPIHDFVVVGGGIIGAMTALLGRRRHPELDIALLDRGSPGSGATGRSAYFDLPYGSTADLRALSNRSRALYRELRTAVAALPIQDLPLYGVCRADAFPEVSRSLTEVPPRTAPTAPEGASTRAPGIPGAPPGFKLPAGAMLLEGLASTRCADDSLVSAVVAALESTPRTRVIEGADVVEIRHALWSSELSLRDGRRIRARRVALCIGPWLVPNLAKLTDATFPIRTKKVVSLLLPIEPPHDAPAICLFDHEAFLLPQPERRRWLFSFRSEEWDCALDAACLTVSADDLARAGAILAAHFDRATWGPLGARVFCDGYTPTREPVIAQLQTLPGTVVIGGAGGSGVRLAPAMAERGLHLLGL